MPRQQQESVSHTGRSLAPTVTHFFQQGHTYFSKAIPPSSATPYGDPFLSNQHTHHDQKQLREERVYFSLQLPSQTLSLREIGARTQGRNLEAEADAETMEECCLLVSSS